MAKTISFAYGLGFLTIGILGAISGAHDHQFMSFGINGLHNTVHVLTGLLALAAAWYGEYYSKLFLWFVVVAYGLVTIGGFLQVPFMVEMLNLNMSVNFLHLFLVAGAAYGIVRSPVRAVTT